MSTTSCTGGGYLLETGTAYRWARNSRPTSNSNKNTAPSLNDVDTLLDQGLNNGSNGQANSYEAAGLTFTITKNFIKVEFVNGTYTGANGSFDTDFKL